MTKGFASIKLGGMTQTLGYDGFGRLGSEAQDSATGTYGPGSESYSYDAAGNRTGTGYSYTVTNAVRGRPAIAGDGWAPGDSLVYDATGNPLWWKNTSTNGYDSLTWDAENRLIRLRRYNSSNQLQLDVNYAYDGLGRRVKKWGSGAGLNQRLYVWNGWELLAETGLSGNAVRKYTHHPEGLDFPLAMRDYSGGGGGYTSLFHLDGQGNVYLLTNTLGERDSEYRYRAWGDRYVTPTGEAVQSPFGYKGREEDRETGLVYMRHRYYSPRLERFVNEDPIGISGGLNVYGFAGLDPANLADRMGLCPTCDTIHVVDKAPLSPAERELFSMWFYDYMNSLINGYDAWSNPFAFASSVPSGKKNGVRFGPPSPPTNKGPRPPEVDPTDTMGACVGASMAGEALVGGFAGIVAGGELGFRSGVAAAPVAAAGGAIVFGSATFELGGVGAAPGFAVTYAGTVAVYTVGFALAGGVLGFVGGAVEGLLSALGAGGCTGSLH